jgi:hypothetical protein
MSEIKSIPFYFIIFAQIRCWQIYGKYCRAEAEGFNQNTGDRF